MDTLLTTRAQLHFDLLRRLSKAQSDSPNKEMEAKNPDSIASFIQFYLASHMTYCTAHMTFSCNLEQMKCQDF